MNATFYIDISIRTEQGPQRYARFDIGENKEAARELFAKLKGDNEINRRDMLYLELVETVHDVPVGLAMASCDLQELGTNCMLITQEVFRLATLKGHQA